MTEEELTAERYGLTAAQCAYGILWRTITDNKMIHAARKELFVSLSKEQRRAGIEFAIKMFGPVSTQEMVAADMQEGIFPHKSLSCLSGCRTQTLRDTRC